MGRLATANGDPRASALAFREKVEQVVKSIPRGQVLSYAQVALRAGKPGGARGVVRALHWISGAPWWRVIRSDGTLAAEVASRQKPKLQREGVLVRGRRVIRRRLAPFRKG